MKINKYYNASILSFIFIAFIWICANPIWANIDQISEETQECIDCHISITPGIVADWQTGRHSKITPGEALAKSELEKRVSSDSIPARMTSNVVGCYECHSLNPSVHADNFEHFGYQINVVVSPNDCRVCHSQEVGQYENSKKAYALPILRDNPVYHLLVETITSTKAYVNDQLEQGESSVYSKKETCYACHGTEVKVSELIEIETELGEIEVPKLENWPNQGVGRINPDGSMGSCAACHPRHSFSIEIARNPATCSQCHLEPDVPAWNVFRESKHGNIFNSIGDRWNWDSVPWTVGEDFTAPTCAVCHNSLVVDSENEIIAERSHDFGDRLWVRIFGLIYSHPQPKTGRTFEIRNADDMPLPVTFDGQPAADYLLDIDGQNANKQKMVNTCRACHSSSWVEGHFVKFDSTIVETDKMVLATTKIMQSAWDKNLAAPENPFDEKIEQMWIKQWLFYANSIRYGSAMMGPDYAAFKNGWWYATENLTKMRNQLEIYKKSK